MKEFVEGLKKHLENNRHELLDQASNMSAILKEIDSFAETFDKKDESDGWIPWGGECPVDSNTLVDVKCCPAIVAHLDGPFDMD